MGQLHERFEVRDGDGPTRIEVDHFGFFPNAVEGDGEIYLELIQPDQSALVTLSRKQARKLGKVLRKAAKK